MPRRLLLIPRYRVPMSPLATDSSWAVAPYGVWQGVGIMTAAPARLLSPTYAYLRNNPTAWGFAALLFGVLVAVGMWRKHFVVKAIGLAGLFFWSLIFATSALTAYVTSPIAGPTGPPAYYLISFWIGVIVWADPSRKAPDVPLQHPTQ